MKYEIVCWDYDAAPDAEQQYFVGKRKFSNNLEDAKHFAEECVEQDYYVGATVYEASTKRVIYGFGFQLEYR